MYPVEIRNIGKIEVLGKAQTQSVSCSKMVNNFRMVSANQVVPG